MTADPFFKKETILSNCSPQIVTRHQMVVSSLFFPLLEREATFNVVTFLPDEVKRTSGSAPKLPAIWMKFTLSSNKNFASHYPRQRLMGQVQKRDIIQSDAKNILILHKLGNNTDLLRDAKRGRLPHREDLIRPE